MKRTVLLTIILLALVAGCSKDEGIPPDSENQDKGTVISLTARMPNEEQDTPATRVALEQDNLNIKTTWEAGDKIYLVFAQSGTAKGKQIVTLAADDITDAGKIAHFSITVPSEISSEIFDLYGVHGVTGFTSEESYEVSLSGAPWSGTLTQVQNKDVAMLRFATTGISKANSSASVTFAHLGSLFHIKLMRSGSAALNGITKAELVAASAIQAEQGSGSPTYNLVSDSFSGTSATGTSLPFEISSTDLTTSGTVEFWGWYPPVADQNWPGLGLKITTTGGTYLSTNGKPARSSATAAGKAYHFYASYDGANLNFTNSSGTVNTGYLLDSRDNNVYKTVTIGTQTWIAENLKYLSDNSGALPEGYDVFGYTGTDVSEAKATENYKTYGVLYNWSAAMNGAASSDANPSSIQGVCPPGWHLPSVAEWTTFTNYLADNGYNYDGTTGGNKAALAVAAADVWRSSTVAGAPGNTDYPDYINKSGFSALPAGWRDKDGSYLNMGQWCFWWTTNQYSDERAIFIRLKYDQITIDNISTAGHLKANGYSVRCLKD